MKCDNKSLTEKQFDDIVMEFLNSNTEILT